ncbi:hypothetical protein SVIOM342S_05002 [Streptomyces violaceorubidus]
MRRIWHGEGLEESNTLVEETGQPTGKAVHDVIDAEQLSLYAVSPVHQLGACADRRADHPARRDLPDPRPRAPQSAPRGRRGLGPSLSTPRAPRRPSPPPWSRSCRRWTTRAPKKAITALSGRSPDLDAVRTLLQGHGAADARRPRPTASAGRSLAPGPPSHCEGGDPPSLGGRRGLLRTPRVRRGRPAVGQTARRPAPVDRPRHPDASDCPVCGSTGNLFLTARGRNGRAHRSKAPGGGRRGQGGTPRTRWSRRQVHDLCVWSRLAPGRRAFPRHSLAGSDRLPHSP